MKRSTRGERVSQCGALRQIQHINLTNGGFPLASLSAEGRGAVLPVGAACLNSRPCRDGCDRRVSLTCADARVGSKLLDRCSGHCCSYTESDGECVSHTVGPF